MSADPEAVIYYGFPLPDFDNPEYSYHDKNDEWEKQQRPEEPADRSDYTTPEWDAWREKFQAWRESPEYIEIDWSGGEGCEAFYVSVESLKHSVEWDEQKPLAGIDLSPQPEADLWLRQFCEHFGIEWKEPGWHLAARYF